MLILKALCFLAILQLGFLASGCWSWIALVILAATAGAEYEIRRRPHMVFGVYADGKETLIKFPNRRMARRYRETLRETAKAASTTVQVKITRIDPWNEELHEETLEKWRCEHVEGYREGKEREAKWHREHGEPYDRRYAERNESEFLDYGADFRELVEEKISVLIDIPERERFLSDGDKLTEFLGSIITERLAHFDQSSAPQRVRPILERGAARIFSYGIRTHCLLFGSDFRGQRDERINLEQLSDEWIHKSLTLHSCLRGYYEYHQEVPAAIFNETFNSKIEPVQTQLGLGWWRREKNRKKFERLFKEGILLALLYDTKSTELSKLNRG